MKLKAAAVLCDKKKVSFIKLYKTQVSVIENFVFQETVLVFEEMFVQLSKRCDSPIKCKGKQLLLF